MRQCVQGFLNLLFHVDAFRFELSSAQTGQVQKGVDQAVHAVCGRTYKIKSFGYIQAGIGYSGLQPVVQLGDMGLQNGLDDVASGRSSAAHGQAERCAQSWETM